MKRLTRFIDENKSATLFASACMILLLEPLTRPGGPGEFIMIMSYLMILMFGPYLLTANRKLLWLTLIVGIPGIFSRIMLSLELTNGLYYLFGGFLILFAVVMASTSVYYTCTKCTKSSEAIFGTILSYLFLGICFAQIYHFIYLLDPKSFAVPAGYPRAVLSGQFIYFSYVTLSTLGYGDFVPVSDIARRLASIEAIIGVLYVAVFIGRVLSMMHKDEVFEEVHDDKKRKARIRGRFKNRSKLPVRRNFDRD